MNTTTNSALTLIKGRTATRSSVVRDNRLSAVFFDLLRAALGDAPGDLVELNAEEWYGLYKQVSRQSLLGVAFYALQRVYPDIESRIPKDLYLKWFYQAEAIRGLNQTHYELSKKLTSLFAERGAKSVILKGQANSRIYPDKFIRQTGDIDIWVVGGRDKVISLLSHLGLLKNAKFSAHEVTLSRDAFGVDVEVHFNYIYDCRNPFANKCLKKILSYEIECPVAVDEGFNVASNKFSLLMQLSHIRKHLLGQGIGFRQIMDYAVLLRSSNESERAQVSQVLAATGLRPMAGALMWVLSECLGVKDEYLLCSPDSCRGKVLLAEMSDDGNFGKNAKRKRGGVFRWWLRNRLRLVRMLPFDFPEVSWFILRYWAMFLYYIPKRIYLLYKYKK